MKLFSLAATITALSACTPLNEPHLAPYTLEVSWDADQPVARVTVDCAEREAQLEDESRARRVYEDRRDRNEIAPPLRLSPQVPVGWTCEVQLHRRSPGEDARTAPGVRLEL